MFQNGWTLAPVPETVAHQMKEIPVAEPATKPTEQIAYLNITFSEKGISEFNGERRVVFIPRAEVMRIESRTGSRAERPLVQLIAGVILGGLGVYGVFMAFRVGLALLRWEAGFIVFGAMGIWLLIESLRQGHYLLVTCSKEKRKLVFDGKVDESAMKDFLTKAGELGYNSR
jgi:hypothetical protein